MRNKQVEFNPYIYNLSKLSRFGYEISVFKYTTGRYSEQPPKQPAHTARMFLHGKMDVKIFLMFIVAENTWIVNIRTWSEIVVIDRKIVRKMGIINTESVFYCPCGYIYKNVYLKYSDL